MERYKNLQTRLSFKRGATNEDVEREIANNRGGDVLEVDLAETQINDEIANSLSKMPKLRKIDLSQTVEGRENFLFKIFN